ncbi:MFS transporter [Candidatus Entotheonella palauensis]|uniref:MFS transporter n=1 Tax=Candidatus Entotheonella palauensis TaxID=93172 RepID=UPI000B7EC96F|nr:MFS transporter [Candidatus Entotheonella palauensis]
MKRSTSIFYGWWIVAVSLLADALKHGTFNRGFTLYILPIRSELGLGVATISLAEMLGRMEGGVLGPVMGYLTDRYGPRVMLAFGGIMSGLGFILLSFTGSLLSFMLIFVGMLSVGFRSGYNNATLPAVNQWFRRKRSLAMSIVAAGNGLGGATLAPLVGLMVFSLGWRTAALLSGLAILAVVVPLSRLIRPSPESMGLLPDGDPHPAEPVAQTPATIYRDMAADFTASEAMHTWSYWLLIVATGLRNVVHAGMSFLIAPVVVWFLQGGGRGEAESLRMAAYFVGLLSLGTFVLTPMLGWMGDRISKPRLCAVCMAIGALSMTLFLNRSGDIRQLVLGVLLLAVAESANPLNWAIMGDFFGRRSFATLRGWQHLPDQFMSMSTPVWMGWIFDHTGSYYWSLLPLAAVYGLSACVYWFLPRPNIPDRLRKSSELG